MCDRRKGLGKSGKEKEVSGSKSPRQDLGRSRNKTGFGAQQYLDSWKKASVRAAPWLSRFVTQQILFNLEMMRLGDYFLSFQREHIERWTPATSECKILHRFWLGPLTTRKLILSREVSYGYLMAILLIHTSFLTEM